MKSAIVSNTLSRHCTLKDVAAQVGLSVSAVSQILNNKSNDFSSEENKERVRQVARELGYRQSFRHKLMRGDATKTTALLLSLPRLEQEEHIQLLLTCLTRNFNQTGYATYIYRLTECADDNSRIIRELAERGTERFILIGPPVEHERLTAEIEAFGCFWICYSQANGLERVVDSDVTHGCEAVIRHLLSNGLHNFRLLSSLESNRLTALYRCFPDSKPEELLQRYLRLLGMPPDVTISMDEFAATGMAATRALLDAEPEVQAIFYLSDYFAMGGIRELVRRGIPVAQWPVLAGFNHIYAVRVSPFPVISVQHNIAEIARQLVLHAGSSEPVRVIVPTQLIT